ncbi:MAG: hypothetical protein ISR58_00500 [Anaerolineales bacterium]|nr:hypothetical protein [Chloroflexota bacterium]MBL6979643.1 hypothetical protein [Anaerolineales bacterium]
MTYQQPYYPTKSRVTATLLAKAIFRRFIWQGRMMPAFWTVMSSISLLVNIILIVLLVSIGQQLFTLKKVVSDQLVTGLHQNFQAMNKAVIDETIVVDDKIPVQFDLPVSARTRVTLTEPTQINGAHVSIAAGVLNINAPANIVLPAGTSLPIALDIIVPVDESVPVSLNVPVYIELKETGLGVPFDGLINVVSPYDSLLMNMDDSWEDTEICQGPLGFFCEWFLIP